MKTRNFTFGICVSPDTNLDYLKQQITSITQIKDGLKYWELILAGDLSPEVEDYISEIASEIHLKWLLGEEKDRGWITHKKNQIATYAKYDNLCIMHDYYVLPSDFCVWLPEKYDVYCAPIKTLEGKRHSDWLVSPKKMEIFLKSIHF